MTKLIGATVKKKIKITANQIDANPYLFTAFKGATPAGIALVISRGDQAILWDIHVDDAFRRCGYGTALITAIKSMYKEIFTGARTPEGDKLIASCGFNKIEGQVGLTHRWEKD